MKKTQNTLQGIIQFLIYLSPFVFPLYLIRFQLAGIPFTALESFTYLLFGLWVLALLLKKLKLSWEKPLRYYWLAAFVLIIGATIGVLTAPHYITLPSNEILDAQRATLGVWKGWVIAPLLYFAVLTQTLKKESVDVLLRLFVYAGALVALVAYGYGVFNGGVTYDFRLSGFFESANYLSLYLVPPTLIAIYFLFSRRLPLKWFHTLDLSALAIMLHALFFTKSYAAFLGVFGAVFLYLFLLVLKKGVATKKGKLALFVVFLTFAVVLFSQVNTPKFKQALDFKNRSSSSVRLEVYEIAASLIREEPLTGIGPGLFQAEYQTRGRTNLGRIPLEWNIPHPHNVFLAFWLNAGLLGLIALILFIAFAHIRFTYPLMAFWGILIHGLFDTPFWKNDLAMIWWIVLASVVILQTYGTDSPQKQKAPIRKRLAPKRASRPRVKARVPKK